ncbi:bifunctional DNA primase/polymerase [Nocardia asteroides]|nr:bifunctional DNA primase/polymerase [Nocardia asteroides]UGT63948.1 bifunctional DNA primase/polymerase [Nocardia asteroides]
MRHQPTGNPAEAAGGNDVQRAAREYFERGYWPIPLVGESGDGSRSPKSPAIAGYHGYRRPDDAEVLAMIETIRLGSALGISLPVGVVGIDVDTYGEKQGGTTLCALEAELGPLPPTWHSTRRGPQPPTGTARSAIYLFQLPPEAFASSDYPKLRSTLGDNIEVVQYHERVIACAPTVLEGMAYRWYGLDGAPAELPPDVGDLPVLPVAWWDRLCKPDTAMRYGEIIEAAEKMPPPEKRRRARVVPRARLDRSTAYERMSVGEAESWARTTLPGWDDDPNEFMHNRIEQVVDQLRRSGSRHDDARSAMWNLLCLAAGGEAKPDGGVTPGNAGGAQALWAVAEELIRIRNAERNRTGAGEAERMLTWAIAGLRAQIEDGSRQPSGGLYGPELDEDELADIAEWLERLHEGSDTDEPDLEAIVREEIPASEMPDFDAFVREAVPDLLFTHTPAPAELLTSAGTDTNEETQR